MRELLRHTAAQPKSFNIGHALPIQPLIAPLELIQIQVTPRGSECLKLNAVDRTQITGNQADGSAELRKSSSRRNESYSVVLTKVGDGLEVGFKPVDQPKHFDTSKVVGAGHSMRFS